ncbi:MULTISPECIES: YaiO family outer membrane beta-barrel protein [unclassified Kaistella]|uniref:YaiO family outer membrane beta-barrel protein n=1 Tax=unclassified Kaistella TaxID=2762626 RepID=UPI002735799E|nr:MULTISPECIES: YaiO family outer membrane beta-barrel protein [unclassified Kaistella]MDP2453814.1 YaiO family outer membrane beta-barrel protein [Kaistella sp. SH11-4b]MDP2456871.1 YaiO family outer membrane beta-barrel protein [Kaistella sp. SH40-3]MDP2459627.1 YaiO family outer membrane beta-barrel protein [Kaistella sp. SH19-2b]
MDCKTLLFFTLFISGAIFAQSETSDSAMVIQNQGTTLIGTSVKQQKDSLSEKKQNQIGIMHLQSVYDSGLSTMSITSVQYLRRINNENVTVIGRVNIRARAKTSSTKYDLEAYIKHGKKHYSFVGASVSDQKMFPGFEASYSFYSALKKGWELETGVKYLSAENFSLFTPVIGAAKEFGNNLVTFRNFFTFTQNEFYYANILSWKNFFNEKRDYFSLMTGFGNAPDSKNIDFSEGFISNESFFVGLGYEKNLKPFKLSASSVYNRNNYSIGRKFNQFDFYLNLFYDF